MYVRPVYSDVMADGNIVADGDGGFAEKRVQYTAILNIDAVADGDGIDIAAQDGAKPYAAFSPMVTSPIMVAFSARKVSAPITGVCPRSGMINAICICCSDFYF